MKTIKRKKKITIADVLVKQQKQLDSIQKQINAVAECVMRIQQPVYQRPPVENIRVSPLAQVPLALENEVLNWTTNQVNKHLDSLSGPDLQDIVESAITGKPIAGEVKHHPNGTQGKMADWLNANIGTVNTQENIWNAIGEAQVIAKKRNARRAIEAKEFTKEWKNAVGLSEALRLADEGTAKTSTEIEQALGNNRA